ncbi:MAG TPA: hypothetical protein VMU25_01285 [Candidatus Paceibacterota bacterium]|nr:hypothetical protein [Candidatus Paceibacterota bacterium]
MKLHPFAILLGVITDLVLSVVVGLIVSGFAGLDNHNSSFFAAWSLLLGLAALAVGGYVTAWRAISSKLFNATIFGIIEMLVGLGALVISPPMPIWFVVSSLILTVPAGLLGAYIVVRVESANN